MTDDTPDADEAYGALTSVDNELRAAKEELHGSRHDEEDAADILQSVSGELASLVDTIEDAQNKLGAAMSNADEAYGHIEETDSRLDVIESFLEDADEEPAGEAGEVTIDGTTYDVYVVPQDTDDAPEETFGEWLSGVLEAASVDEMWLAENSLVARPRLEDILNGTTPRGDEGPSIIKTLSEGDVIGPETQARGEAILEDD